MLFFPAFWWHQVTSSELTISMNIFFGNDGDNIYTTKIMSGRQWPSFRYWLLNIVEQNREKEQFQKVLQYLDQSLYNFLWKQWKDSIPEEQVDQLVKVILDYLGLSETPPITVIMKHPPPIKIRGLLWRSWYLVSRAKNLQALIFFKWSLVSHLRIRKREEFKLTLLLIDFFILKHISSLNQ